MKMLAALVTDDYHVAFADYAGGLRQGWHTHARAILTLNLGGAKREGTERGDRLVEAWQVGVKPPEIRHTDHFGPTGVRAVRIALTPNTAHHGDLFARWTWTTCPAASRALLRVADGLVRGVPLAEIDGHVNDAIAAMVPLLAQDDRGCPPTWLQIARERILDEDGRPTLGTLAVQAGVHPVHFAARFRHYFRTSVGGFRQTVKAVRAAALIRESRFSISAIAALTEYSDQPHLTHHFGAEIGVTPSRFRALIHGIPPFKRTRHAKSRR